MRASSICLVSAGLAGLLCACSDPAPASPDLRAGEERDLSAAPADQAAPPDLAGADLTGAPSPTMSFFITSDKGGGNLGGLAGADARCQRLAAAVGLGGKSWAAYLSAYAQDGRAAVNAKDRIGAGPWYDFTGAKVADSVAQLHDQQNLGTVRKMVGLDEKGQAVPGRGDTPNEHDILTGSQQDGTVNGTATCANWTSDGDDVTGAVGHFDRVGGGANPMSWNFAHASTGCSAAKLVSTGGAGRLYCFAK